MKLEGMHAFIEKDKSFTLIFMHYLAKEYIK